MKLFQLQEDGSYVVVIKNSLRFDLAIQHVSVGLSFRQTATVMTQYRNACKIPKLAGINDHMHIRVCVHGVLYNLHLVLVPFFKRHTAQNYVKLIKVLLDSLSPIWRDKVISISSDGKNTMAGHHGGVVTLLEQECLNPVLRIWCVPHQLDIEVKNATHGVLDESFYKTAHAFSVHLRAQQTLMTEIGSKCPKDTTHWIAFSSILKWLLQHRRQLMAHVTNK
ncbi:hypothetical protein BASA81_015949 [Batrachochytrium salamandrivorans]|nr:hypothetical protein BASA81_015949 [Batrachochytrium salamandrivorans]